MRETMPDATKETAGNRALNRQESPSWSPVEDGQFTLGSASEKCHEGAVHLAALAKASRAGNGYSLGTIASLVGKETPYVSKVLDVDAPHSALHMLAAVVLLDKDRTFLRGLARAAGCEVVERPRLTPEQKLERLIETLRRHGKIGEAFLEESFGEDAP